MIGDVTIVLGIAAAAGALGVLLGILFARRVGRIVERSEEDDRDGGG